MAGKGTKRLRNPDRLLASSVHERRLAAAGVPLYCWNPRISALKTQATPFRGEKVSAIAQKHWLKSIVKEPPRRSPFIAIVSTPTDTGALYAAHLILNGLRKLQGFNSAIINSAGGIPFFEEPPRCVLIHNVLDNVTAERAQKVRDLLVRFRFAFRLVVVAGATAPETWAAKKIGKHPDMVLKVKDCLPQDLLNEA